ncbi:hypothetical protein GCM10010401_12940 [Rarobacter faecitabidus]|uniref:Hemolysin type calcium-binding protein n=1 Tax=Rarobacter faecitabidus TaxID=13243 RepID=A0A542ZEC5_RARFA|nr:calcium-binding protein [Rarobacter faecitabidus]TQL58657.1 hemolysin type calcium-binding protein [Rarobacter faecitabidus]
MNRWKSLLLAAVLIPSTLVAVTSATPAHADYDQSGWHASSVWNEGATNKIMVIDCASMIIGNMSGGTSYSSSGWTYTPPAPVLPTTGIIAGMGVEVDLDGAHPRVGESFYVHIWGRSVGTPCGAEGFIPIFVLPAGVSLDTTKAVVCFSDGQPLAAPTCPQPGAAGAKFQSAQAETGSANSYKILCGYNSGCLGEYAWPAAYGHGFEFGIPVKSSQTSNSAKVTGGAWVVDADHNGLLELNAPLNVFAGSGATSQPPADLPVVGGGTQPDPGTAYRVVYDMPSTQASPKYRFNPSLSTTYGIVSTAEVYTNHVPGAVVFARDTERAAIANISNSASVIDNCTAGVDQMVAGAIDNIGASYRSEFDWRAAGCGSNPAGLTGGTTYYWRYGYIPLPGGGSDIATAKVTWGEVQSFVAPMQGAMTCHGSAVTVSIALGQEPTDGDDVILGTPGPDAINGGLGNDTICAGGGNDVVMGGPGNDYILGGDGDDTLLPGTGNDSALGEAGTDTLSYSDIDVPIADTYPGVKYFENSSCAAMPGPISVCGAAGYDMVGGGSNGAYPERFVGTRFKDWIVLALPGSIAFGGDGDDFMTAGAQDVVIAPGLGNDTVNAFQPGGTVSYADQTGPVAVSLALTSAQNTISAGTDTISGFANLVGGSGNDTLTGSDAPNTIVGGSGRDSITAGDGDDIIDVHDGETDTVACGNGTDRVRADGVDIVTACEKLDFPALHQGAVTVTGTARLGGTLQVQPGTWDRGIKVSYQWLADGKPIAGANAGTFKPTISHVGHTVSVRLTASYAATNVGSVTSSGRKIAKGLLVKGKVKITGKAKPGKTLRAKVTGWGPAPLKVKYRWFAGGKPIKRATKAKLTLKSPQRGKRIAVKVTVTKAGYESVTSTSAKTKRVR